MLLFTLEHPRAHPEMLGMLPLIWDEADPRSAREQANDRYAHGGGWEPMEGFTLRNTTLKYKLDAHPLLFIASAKLHDEIILLYSGAWVAIVQPDGTYEVARMD